MFFVITVSNYITNLEGDVANRVRQKEIECLRCIEEHNDKARM